MENVTKQPSKKGVYTTIVGTILVALCCFTPLLVATVAIIGFGALTPYLDYILFPILALLVILTYRSYYKYKQKCKACGINK